MRTTTKGKVIIESDGVTVWVNNDICCIGRFGKMGIDIHRDIRQDVPEGEDAHCLHCTHAFVTLEDWHTFRKEMKSLHDVDVPQKHMPTRFLQEYLKPKPPKKKK